MEKLKHGKFLNSKNFPQFVESWNEIVDFISNLRGDGDENVDGVIKVDRTNPGHPIIRIPLRQDSIFGRVKDLTPWKFYKERAGFEDGWHNQTVQIGMNVIRKAIPSQGFTDSTNHVDGRYFLKVDVSPTSTLNEQSCEIVVYQSNPPEEPGQKVYLYLGKVENGSQSDGIYSCPCVYVYL